MCEECGFDDWDCACGPTECETCDEDIEECGCYIDNKGNKTKQIETVIDV